MIDVKLGLIDLIEKAVPQLKDKIQAGAVDAETPVPYATYSQPEEKPIRTFDGIAGYETIIEIGVYHNKMPSIEVLKNNVIKAVEGIDVNNRKCRYRSGQYSFFQEMNIHGYNLIFKI